MFPLAIACFNFFMRFGTATLQSSIAWRPYSGGSNFIILSFKPGGRLHGGLLPLQDLKRGGTYFAWIRFGQQSSALFPVSSRYLVGSAQMSKSSQLPQDFLQHWV
jgi:hypothetical protein